MSANFDRSVPAHVEADFAVKDHLTGFAEICRLRAILLGFADLRTQDFRRAAKDVKVGCHVGLRSIPPVPYWKSDHSSVFQ